MQQHEWVTSQEPEAPSRVLKRQAARPGEEELSQTALPINRMQKTARVSRIREAKGETRCTPGGTSTSALSEEYRTFSQELVVDLRGNIVIDNQAIATLIMKEADGG